MNWWATNGKSGVTTTNEIADALKISTKTVYRYIKQIDYLNYRGGVVVDISKDDTEDTEIE